MHLLRSRAAGSAATTAGILAVLQTGIGLPWPVWVVWIGITGVALGVEHRAHRTV